MKVTVANLVRRNLVKSITLAGGYGGRLNAVTDPRNRYPIAKAIVPIGARRSIHSSLDAVQQLGIKQTFLSVWHLVHTIEQLVKSTPDFQIHYITERVHDPLDTAGPVVSIVKDRNWDSIKQIAIIVQSSDIVHNIPLKEVLQRHLKKSAAVTAVVNPVSWDQIHRFGTVRLEGMPQRSDFKSEIEFEDAVGAWIINHQNVSARIMEFREKRPRFNPDPENCCLSNLNNSSIYIFSTAFLRTLMTMMTKKGKNEPLFPDLYKEGGPVPFSDWGRHIFKWLTEPENRGQFPFYAYVIPDSYYWRDIGVGEDIRQANMDVLDEKIEGGLKDFSREEWGWRGKNVFIDPSARINKSLIADNCIIGPRVWIDNSVIGENTTIEADSHIHRSVIFPKPLARQKPNKIGERVHMVECLFLGGLIQSGSSFERKMVYSPTGGAAIDSLYTKVEII